MEISDRLCELRPQQQLKVMARVFQKLSLAFGNQLLAKWQDIDMEMVYQDWSESMQSLSLGAINYGIEVSKRAAHPPSQGEFIANCQQFKHESNVLMLESKLSPEQIAANRARIADIAKKLAGAKAA